MWYLGHNNKPFLPTAKKQKSNSFISSMQPNRSQMNKPINHKRNRNLPVHTDKCDRYAILQGGDGCPLSCPLLSCTVFNFRQQVSSISVLVLQDVCCDFDQERVQLGFIPLIKSLEGNTARFMGFFMSTFVQYKTIRESRLSEGIGGVWTSPEPSHHDPYATHLSSGGRLHRSAACLRTLCHYEPSLQSVQLPHLQPEGHIIAPLLQYIRSSNDIGVQLC